MAFEFESRVRYSETDPQRKLTLVSLVDYFQDASTFQSEDCGVGMRFLKDQQLAWMILYWEIEIVRRPLLAEKIYAQTWPYGFKAFYGYRNYVLLDENRDYLAKANGVWAMVDMESGHPTRVRQSYIDGMTIEEPLDMEYGPRKLKMPEEGIPQDAFPVCRHHLDTNNHVNNGQYIGMAEEYLPEHFETERLKVEYRQQAKLYDMITPYIYKEENKVTVSLCDEQAKPYAIVVFERSR